MDVLSQIFSTAPQKYKMDVPNPGGRSAEAQQGQEGQVNDIMTHLSCFLLHIFVAIPPCQHYMHFSQINQAVSQFTLKNNEAWI